MPTSEIAARRFILIDSIRGLAALAVACFHFYNQLAESSSETPLWGLTVQTLMTHGDLGVFVFFVLSGFVIACSLHRVRITGLVVGKFALRRSLRLDPAYWTTIWITTLLIVAAQSRGMATGQRLPGVTDVLANMFYLDNLLGFRSIVKVGWTLCLELQFYLVFVACGVVTWWTLSAEVNTIWFGLTLGGCVAAALATGSPAAWVAAGTGLGIYAAGRTGRIDTLLSGSVFRYLGRISYSFYLLHPLVGTNFIRVVQRVLSPDAPLNPWLAAVLFVAAIVASVVASHLLYRLIELPSHRVSRRIRWSAAGAETLEIPGSRPIELDGNRAPALQSATSPEQPSDAHGPLARLWAFAMHQRRWLAFMAALVLIWTVELFVVQATTLVYPNEVTPRFAFWAPKIRFALDLMFILALTLVLKRRILAVVIAGSFLVYLGLVTYHHYFLRPLSLTTLSSNWREGLDLGAFALDLFPKGAALVLAGVLLVKLATLVLAPKVELPRRFAWGAALLLLLAYGSLAAMANRIDPLEAIRTTRGVGRLGEIRGYLGPWFAEWYYLHDGRMLSAALERRKTIYDRLTPIEANIPVHDKLVFVQAESLDHNILNYRVAGQEVTPFLNRLREASMFYRVRAVHTNGSSDADFAVLNGVIGSEHVNTYTVPDYPYENTTPQALEQAGYATSSFHGNSGEFYSRRGPFQKMGLNQIFFREEMEDEYGLKADRWGIRDNDVLALASQKLRTADRPTCHFIITLTTHVPYTMLAPTEHDLFRHPRDVVERYLNNMRYLDNCLRDYIASLGKGTTVVIYADHPTEEGNDRFQPDRDGAREYIPCLSKVQKTRQQPIATDGTLNLVDVVNFVRGQVARTHPGPAQAAAAPKE
jgi:peptidoglycan/LPS O-acetylase OafA/YrhL